MFVSKHFQSKYTLVYNVCSAHVASERLEQVEDPELDNEVFLLPE